MTGGVQSANDILIAFKRAMDRFLALPTVVVVSFLLITTGVYLADEGWGGGASPAGFGWLGRLLGDSKAVAALLSTLTSSTITVTSITFSLLLIALQQGSSALTTKVTDQFLMRRTNQFFFGYFVGLSVFVLFNFATASELHRPVFGASIAVILTMVALCMIVVMIYSTIDQMQPTQIVRAIHRHVLGARERQAGLLRQTRRAPRDGMKVVATLRADQSGYIQGIDVDKVRAAVSSLSRGEIEVEMVGSIGRFLAHGDPMAVLRSAEDVSVAPDALDGVRSALFAALTFQQDRGLRWDAAYGIEQLETIGWTSISTAKSNPAPGLDVIESLRDILSIWAGEGTLDGDASASVVVADTAPREALDALENLILVASESMQAQTLADALDTITVLLSAVPDAWADRLADMARRGLSSLGEHVLTTKLEMALDRLISALGGRGFDEVAQRVGEAKDGLAGSVGRLNSRSTRVPARA